MQEEKRKITKKNIFLIFLLVLIFAFIFIFWLLNFVKVVKSTDFSFKPQDEEKVMIIKEDLKETIESFKKLREEQDFKTFEDVYNESEEKDSEIEKEKESDETEEVDKEKEEEGDFEEKVERVESIENKNCPAYANCMPVVGGQVDCSVPLGCEGITQLVY